MKTHKSQESELPCRKETHRFGNPAPHGAHITCVCTSVCSWGGREKGSATEIQQQSCKSKSFWFPERKHKHYSGKGVFAPKGKENQPIPPGQGRAKPLPLSFSIRVLWALKKMMGGCQKTGFYSKCSTCLIFSPGRYLFSWGKKVFGGVLLAAGICPELSSPLASQDDKMKEEKPTAAAGDVTYLYSDIDCSFAGLHLKIMSDPEIEA